MRKQQKVDLSDDDEEDSDGEDAFMMDLDFMMDLENKVEHALEVNYPEAITPNFEIYKKYARYSTIYTDAQRLYKAQNTHSMVRHVSLPFGRGTLLRLGHLNAFWTSGSLLPFPLVRPCVRAFLTSGSLLPFPHVV